MAPTHHDFLLQACKDQAKSVGRLIFDVFVQQKPKLILGIKDVRVELQGAHLEHVELGVNQQVRNYVLWLFPFSAPQERLQWWSRKPSYANIQKMRIRP